MMALYLFCAALGIPLIALFAFSSGDGDAELGDGGFDMDADGGDFDLDVSGADGGVGDLTALFRRIPISSYASFLAFFGGVGVVSTWVGVGVIATFILALVLGLASASINTAAFAFLRSTDASSHFTDRQLEGRLATVSVPIEEGRRGRVWLDTGDERVQLTAGAIDRELDVNFERGEEVVIVEVENGIAKVMRAPDLDD
ncbi:MAG: hypothetical protein ACR2P0_17370 [Acidimicrobiales bacterium]